MADDLHGTFVERNSSDGSHEHLQPIRGDQDCRVERNPANGLLWIQVWSMDELTMKIKYGAGSEVSHQGESRLDFGADVQGWTGPRQVGLAFRCDNPENARMGRPYVAVGVAAGDVTDPRSEKVHRAVLDIALKYAKDVVAGYPCANPVKLPDTVPGTVRS
ncbi:hypothetical protein ACIBJD_07625 [Kitasatospora sp. NPDC050467]|uniref:hypothetical protein n=1 Tax=Kitasatospora sp. NPDC050467 TaxID=3364053 RepID=UPI0037B5DD6A